MSQHSADKLLIVNSDDFGITERASDAILTCHLAGSVTSTTLMSSMPAADYAAELARSNPSLGIGLHFNLTLGNPLAGKASSIVDANGSLPTRRRLVQLAVTGRLRAEDIYAELEAQYSRIRILGISPTHMDSHQHVHAIPVVFKAFSTFASEHKLPIRMPWPWIGTVTGKRFRRRVKERILSMSLRHCSGMIPPGVRTNSGFCSVFDLPSLSSEPRIDAYRTLLAPYGHGVVELMVHPAYVDDELKDKTAITDISEMESKLLADDTLRRIAEELGFRLGTFRDLQRETFSCVV
ncbi:MAG: ChbG/HpnK family deacetylase [Xanthomonadales bacterium]|nr:ChbG/HpnK family deacetylase [Xanthomonadales bacterium]